MAEGKRPGGLTALAVLNFVFGGIGALGLLALFAMLSVAKGALDAAGQAAVETGDLQAQQGIAEINSVAAGSGGIWVAILLSLVAVVLLIASGVGYLGQKRVLGRQVGTGYGVVSLISTIYGIAVLSSGFGIGTIIGLIYPILTLILINTTFKEDLVN